MDRKKKEVATETPKKETPKKEIPLDKRPGHVFYSISSKQRWGFVTEHLDAEKACETVDAYWFEHRRNVSTGKWESNRIFDMHITMRDTRISLAHSAPYRYVPGSLSDARREAKMRERYGDDYRESEGEEDFDSSKYMR